MKIFSKLGFRKVHNGLLKSKRIVCASESNTKQGSKVHITIVRQKHSHLVFLDTGDSAATIWRWAEAAVGLLHLAEAPGMVGDGAALAAHHLDEADAQVGEVDGGAGGQKGVGRMWKISLDLHLFLMKGRGET